MLLQWLASTCASPHCCHLVCQPLAAKLALVGAALRFGAVRCGCAVLCGAALQFSFVTAALGLCAGLSQCRSLTAVRTTMYGLRCVAGTHHCVCSCCMRVAARLQAAHAPTKQVGQGSTASASCTAGATHATTRLQQSRSYAACCQVLTQQQRACLGCLAAIVWAVGRCDRLMLITVLGG
jgi:hypothetical protein